ncbi:MAG: AAA family ATPase [Alphaproteobacteria bacterium]|nr:AAA family ATPase [Alphaproteobacteria bacterium]
MKVAENYKENLLGTFFTPSTRYNATTVKNLILAKKKSVLLKALKKIEPKVEDIEADDNLVNIDLGYGHFLPINLLGNGMTQILSIISAIADESGHFHLLFFDEIENGLHVSAMETLWEAILKNANPHKTQIFMTTHSLDVLKCLKKAKQLEMFDDIDIACFQIDKRDDDTLKAYRFSANAMEKAIHDIGIDIRQ